MKNRFTKKFNFVSLFKSKAFQATLMLGLFLTSLLIALAMFLGNESGNFVIQVEDGSHEKAISITDDLSTNVYVSKIVTEGAGGMTCTNPASFLATKNVEKQRAKVVELAQQAGRTYTEETVYIYTFYIVNTGNQACNIEISLNISNIVGNIDQAIRIMTYNPNSLAEEGTIRIYQAEDSVSQDYLYPTVPELFESDTVIFTQKEFLSAGLVSDPTIIPYTVFMWLDGDDPDATDELFNSSIKFSLDISIAD